MVRLAILPNGSNNPIGTPPVVDDDMVTFIQRVVGGGSNAQIADAFWAEAIPVLREHFRSRRRIMREKAVQAEADTELDAEWPG